jgi:Adenylate and Guanylate cyclase catalytic domain
MDNSNIPSTENLPTTASRIESTGMRERIHLSEQTAMQLIKHGKEDWVVHREDTVEAKGKGKLVTYWLKLKSEQSNGPSSAASSDQGKDEESESVVTLSDLANTELYARRQSAAVSPAPRGNTNRKSISSQANQRIRRLIDWNSELLLRLLKQVVTRREAQYSSSTSQANLTAMARNIGARTMVVDEVAEIIEMPGFVIAKCDAEVQFSDDVVKQLYNYVAKIASMYNDNPCKFGFGHGNGILSHSETTLTRFIHLRLSFPQSTTLNT